MEASRPRSFESVPSAPFLDRSTLVAFSASLTGGLVVDGDAEFKTAGEIHNSRFDRTPLDCRSSPSATRTRSLRVLASLWARSRWPRM